MLTPTPESVTLLVRACRKANCLARNIADALSVSQTSELDDIAGDIEDALFIMRGEPDQDLVDSETDKVIRDFSIPCNAAAKRLMA